MSNALIDFKHAYEEMCRIKNDAMLNLARNDIQLFCNMENPNYSVPDEVLRSMDIKARAQLRMVIFAKKFDSKVRPILFPDIEFSKPQIINFQLLANPKNLPVSKINEFVEELKGLLETYIDETKNERGTMDCVLDFFKACANFMIQLLTLNYCPKFFQTNTGKLEEVKSLQEKILSSYQQLSSDEQSAELRASLTNPNKMELV